MGLILSFRMGENEYSIGDKKLLIMPYFNRDDLKISKFDKGKLNSSNLSDDNQYTFNNFLGHGHCAISYSFAGGDLSSLITPVPGLGYVEFDIRGNQDNFRLNLTDFESNLLEGICSVNGLDSEESGEVRNFLSSNLNVLINNDLNYQIVSEKLGLKKEKNNVILFDIFKKYS